LWFGKGEGDRGHQPPLSSFGIVTGIVATRHLPTASPCFHAIGHPGKHRLLIRGSLAFKRSML